MPPNDEQFFRKRNLVHTRSRKRKPKSLLVSEIVGKTEEAMTKQKQSRELPGHIVKSDGAKGDQLSLEALDKVTGGIIVVCSQTGRGSAIADKATPTF
jgi:hypothetical protein